MVPAVTAALVLNVSPDNAGVVRLGLVPNTSAPDPVSSVTAAARFELEGVPRNVRIPVPVVVVEGAAPAPPPITSAFAARTPELAIVLAALKYGRPPEVPPVSPVPPCGTVTAAFVDNNVVLASGKVYVREAVGPEKVSCCVAIGNVVSESGNVTVRLALNVAGVRDAVCDDVPPARPTRATPSCVAAARLKTPDALVETTEVKAPVFGVVAPTVPLMLMLAVPVRFVTVPEEGVPNAPPLTTNAPELPVLTPRAVATPVPKEVIPVPPFATESVPPRVIAPAVALEGVKPVAPALNEVTAPVDDTMMFAVEYH